MSSETDSTGTTTVAQLGFAHTDASEYDNNVHHLEMIRRRQKHHRRLQIALDANSPVPMQ